LACEIILFLYDKRDDKVRVHNTTILNFLCNAVVLVTVQCKQLYKWTESKRNIACGMFTINDRAAIGAQPLAVRFCGC